VIAWLSPTGCAIFGQPGDLDVSEVSGAYHSGKEPGDPDVSGGPGAYYLGKALCSVSSVNRSKQVYREGKGSCHYLSFIFNKIFQIGKEMATCVHIPQKYGHQEGVQALGEEIRMFNITHLLLTSHRPGARVSGRGVPRTGSRQAAVSAA